jgi:hypothetical protein
MHMEWFGACGALRAIDIDFHDVPAEKLRLADLTSFEAVQRAAVGIDRCHCSHGG